MHLVQTLTFPPLLNIDISPKLPWYNSHEIMYYFSTNDFCYMLWNNLYMYFYFVFSGRKVRRQITVTELRRAARKPCRKLNLKIPFYYDNPIVPATVTTPLPGIAATAPPETLAVNEWIHFWYFCILYFWCITVFSAMLFRKTHQKELKFIRLCSTQETNVDYWKVVSFCAKCF